MDRGLLAEEAVLDEHLPAAGAEQATLEHAAHRRLSLGVGLGDDHALAGGKAIGLHDDRHPARAEVGEGRGDF
jgi:hypothetical protein